MYCLNQLKLKVELILSLSLSKISFFNVEMQSLHLSDHLTLLIGSENSDILPLGEKLSPVIGSTFMAYVG